MESKTKIEALKEVNERLKQAIAEKQKEFDLIKFKKELPNRIAEWNKQRLHKKITVKDSDNERNIQE